MTGLNSCIYQRFTICPSRCSLADIDAIAVTAGPGLALCLSIGLNYAQQLCEKHNLPFIAVNHLEAHTLVARLKVN